MYAAIVFLPLVAAAIAGLFGRTIGDRGSQLVTSGAVILAAILAWTCFFDVGLGHHPQKIQLLRWIIVGEFEANWAFRFDALTSVMLIVVTTVSACVHVYSIGYMADDPSKPRFMSYLSLFTFCMLMLVTADDFVQMYFGWEGVGLASYLLIGFWYEKPSANAAAIKAFVVNRVGDFGFALGIMGCFLLFRQVGFDGVFKSAPDVAKLTFRFLSWDVPALTTICLLLFVGAMGKSAQLFLHTWLPDAMEGPTPVSALIHAATMVTAGVFMVCRLSPMFEYAPDALTVVAIVGASTAIFAATVGLTQTDIKRVIAYSTCSQLGYMFFAAGVSSYGAAMFHLTTHAFFKALLFLGAGSVIHAMHHEQDMRNMGGLRKVIPVTHALMLIGSLALAGIPPFAGFFSKDIVLESAYAAHSGAGMYAYWLGIAAAFLTAFYSWRLLALTFYGKTRADHHTLEHAHESPLVMMVPLFVLAAGAVVSGFALQPFFVGEERGAFWGASLLDLHETLEHAHHGPEWVKFLPLVMGVSGILLGLYFYVRRPDLPGKVARDAAPIYKFLLNKWYFDELYDFLFVRPSLRLGRMLWKQGDGQIIDGLGPDGIAAVTRVASRRFGAIQTGYVYHYAFAMLIGVVAIVSWYLLRANG